MRKRAPPRRDAKADRGNHVEAPIPLRADGGGEPLSGPQARVRRERLAALTDPIRGPWYGGPLEYREEEAWPKDHPFLPPTKPLQFWSGSIYDAAGGQVVRHEASGWRPTDEAWALLARAPELAEKVRRYEEVLVHVRAGLRSKRPDVLAIRLYLDRELPDDLSDAI